MADEMKQDLRVQEGVARGGLVQREGDDEQTLRELRDGKGLIEKAMTRLGADKEAQALVTALQGINQVISNLEARQNKPQQSEQAQASKSTEAVKAAPEIPKELSSLVPAFCESGEGVKLFQELLTESVKNPTSSAAAAVAYLDVVKSFSLKGNEAGRDGEESHRDFANALGSFSKFFTSHCRLSGNSEPEIQKRLESWGSVINDWFTLNNIAVAVKIPNVGQALNLSTMVGTAYDTKQVKSVNSWLVEKRGTGENWVVMRQAQVNLELDRSKLSNVQNLDNSRRGGPLTALTVPRYFENGKGAELFKELADYSEKNPQSPAAIAKAYLHVIKAYPVDSKKGERVPTEFLNAFADFSRQLILHQRSLGQDEEAIAAALRPWAKAIGALSEEPPGVTMYVPIVGGSLDSGRMSHSGGSSEVKTLKSLGVDAPNSTMVKALVNWR